MPRRRAPENREHVTRLQPRQGVRLSPLLSPAVSSTDTYTFCSRIARPQASKISVSVGRGWVGQGFSYVYGRLRRPLFTRVLIIIFCLQQCKSPAHLGHFVCFQRFTQAEPLSPFFTICTLARRRFSPILYRDLQSALFTPILPPENTTGLKIIRGVGSNAGIFSEEVDRARILESK